MECQNGSEDDFLTRLGDGDVIDFFIDHKNSNVSPARLTYVTVTAGVVEVRKTVPVAADWSFPFGCNKPDTCTMWYKTKQHRILRYRVVSQEYRKTYVLEDYAHPEWRAFVRVCDINARRMKRLRIGFPQRFDTFREAVPFTASLTENGTLTRDGSVMCHIGMGRHYLVRHTEVLGAFALHIQHAYWHELRKAAATWPTAWMPRVLLDIVLDFIIIGVMYHPAGCNPPSWIDPDAHVMPMWQPPVAPARTETFRDVASFADHQLDRVPYEPIGRLVDTVRPNVPRRAPKKTVWPKEKNNLEAITKTKPSSMASTTKRAPCASVTCTNSTPVSMLCSGCRCMFYCDAVCQKADWTFGHKLVCATLRASLL